MNFSLSSNALPKDQIQTLLAQHFSQLLEPSTNQRPEHKKSDYDVSEVEAILMELGDLIEKSQKTDNINTLYDLQQNLDFPLILQHLPFHLESCAEDLFEKSQQTAPNLKEAAKLALLQEHSQVWLETIFTTGHPEVQNKLNDILHKMFPQDAQGLHHPSYFSKLLYPILQMMTYKLDLKTMSPDVDGLLTRIAQIIEQKDPTVLRRFLGITNLCLSVSYRTPLQELFDFYDQVESSVEPNLLSAHIYYAQEFAYSEVSFEDYWFLAETLGATQSAAGLPLLADLDHLLKNSKVHKTNLPAEMIKALIHEAKNGLDLSRFIQHSMKMRELPETALHPPYFSQIMHIDQAITEPLIIQEGASAALYTPNRQYPWTTENISWSSLSEGVIPNTPLSNKGYFDLSTLKPGVHHIFMVRSQIARSAAPSLQTVIVLPKDENTETVPPPLPTTPKEDTVEQAYAAFWANTINQARAKQKTETKDTSSNFIAHTVPNPHTVTWDIPETAPEEKSPSSSALWSNLLRTALAIQLYRIQQEASQAAQNEKNTAESKPQQDASRPSSPLKKETLPLLSEIGFSNDATWKQEQYVRYLEQWIQNNRSYVLQLNPIGKNAFVEFPEHGNIFESLVQEFAYQLSAQALG